MPVNGIAGSSRGRGDESVKRSVSSVRGNTKAGGSRKAKSKQKSARGAKKSVGIPKEVLEAEKTALLAEKHAQLENVLEKHDNLVRGFSSQLLAWKWTLIIYDFGNCRLGRYFIWTIL